MQIIDDETNSFFNVNYVRYSIIKALLIYHPKDVWCAMYGDSSIFLESLKSFFRKKIEENSKNLPLKKHENMAFGEILAFLNNISSIDTIVWDYCPTFVGFKKLLQEINAEEYHLFIDREGDEQNTLKSAIRAGIFHASEDDSRNVVGLRISDMLCGFFSHMMQSLHQALTTDYSEYPLKKRLLDGGWFSLDQSHFKLYKLLKKIVFDNNGNWYCTYLGIYADDLIALVGLLDYIDSFASYGDMEKVSLKQHAENYNTLICNRLAQYYRSMKESRGVQMRD